MATPVSFRKTVLPFAAAASAALAAACSSLQPAPGKPDANAAAAGACHADAVAWAVGQPADQTVMARVWRESRAGLVRPISPGQAVTRDHRADRLNVEIGADNRITRVSCG